MFANVVMGYEMHHFDEILSEYKTGQGYSFDTDMTAEDWQAIIGASVRPSHAWEGTRRGDRPPTPFLLPTYTLPTPAKYRAVVSVPTDAYEQLHMAIKAVFNSWFLPRAQRYRCVRRNLVCLSVLVGCMRLHPLCPAAAFISPPLAPTHTPHREYNDIPHDLGTGVTIQSMVFGNMGRWVDGRRQGGGFQHGIVAEHARLFLLLFSPSC